MISIFPLLISNSYGYSAIWSSTNLWIILICWTARRLCRMVQRHTYTNLSLHLILLPHANNILSIPTSHHPANHFSFFFFSSRLVRNIFSFVFMSFCNFYKKTKKNRNVEKKIRKKNVSSSYKYFLRTILLHVLCVCSPTLLQLHVYDRKIYTLLQSLIKYYICIFLFS